MITTKGTKIFQQQGAVLVISLIFMLLTAMIVATLLTTSSTEMKMASNEQFRLEAAQKVESIIDNLYDFINESEEDGFLKAADQRLCISPTDHSDCITEVLPILLASLTTVETAETLNYYVEYEDENVPGYAVLSEDRASSGSFGLYEIHVEYDASELGRGKASAVQGVMVSYGEGSDQVMIDDDGDGGLSIYRDITSD